MKMDKNFDFPKNLIVFAEGRVLQTKGLSLNKIARKKFQIIKLRVNTVKPFIIQSLDQNFFYQFLLLSIGVIASICFSKQLLKIGVR